jgi:hypothetical protein
VTVPEGPRFYDWAWISIEPEPGAVSHGLSSRTVAEKRAAEAGLATIEYPRRLT